MKISLDWISDFVDLSRIDAPRIVDQLTLCTAEVEGFEILRRSVEGVLIGEVVAVEPVEAGVESGAEPARLRLATVDCGRARYVTVCGAPNLRPGQGREVQPRGQSGRAGNPLRGSLQ